MVISSLCVSAALVGADPIVSRFDDGLEGWTAGVTTDVFHAAEGGAPGGFLVARDAGGVEDMRVFAPAVFLGDRTAFDGGLLSFDVRHFPNGGGPLCLSSYGRVRLVGGGQTLVRDVADCPEADCWRRYDAPLTAEFWGVTPEAWTLVLADLTEVSLRLEAVIGDEDEGLDNVALLPPGVANTDLTGDGVTDAADLAVLLGQWGPCASCCPADLNGDGVVASADLAELLGGWG